MLVALNAIATAQAHITTTTMGNILWLLNFAETYTNDILNYHVSDMILHVASNASYLCK